MHTKTKVGCIALIVGTLSISSASATAPTAELVPTMLNPAVTQTTIGSTICKTQWVQSQRDVNNKTKAAVFAAAGIAKADQKRFVIDHVLPLELGGTNHVSNLVAQPAVESKKKDAVENTLRRNVCANKTTLQNAQLAIVPIGEPRSARSSRLVHYPPPSLRAVRRRNQHNYQHQPLPQFRRPQSRL
jgi:hypothetical protein